MLEWQAVHRPGYMGKQREDFYKKWDEEYVHGQWRLAWKVGDRFVDFPSACALYEDAYFNFLVKNPLVLDSLVSEAVDVYDDEPSNTESGFDYLKQETKRTHLQDIAIRRSVLRLGLNFRGKDLIRIRQEKGTHPLSLVLSPGQVPFHMPKLIERPEINGWWHFGTVESFYQSNRFLQVLAKD